ncbi:hypothetical protein NQ854_19025 [Rhodococcus ruber]|uniref:hypothetical protein n=1 Tax=Rhodococcus TaxID=1827 RepID=UPI0011236FB4|nr:MULTISPECIES: hypothetical protein [Rhodococcus]MCZ1074491.1 hypothetical protein [Rhodococcus sp. A5(2022)]MDO1481912.1 hypothetical protein [Rhodococcus ruber]QDC15957.1 hypothetical protein E2561_19085 [Rhodococcus ruber]
MMEAHAVVAVAFRLVKVRFATGAENGVHVVGICRRLLGDENTVIDLIGFEEQAGAVVIASTANIM